MKRAGRQEQGRGWIGGWGGWAGRAGRVGLAALGRAGLAWRVERDLNPLCVDATAVFGVRIVGLGLGTALQSLSNISF